LRLTSRRLWRDAAAASSMSIRPDGPSTLSAGQVPGLSAGSPFGQGRRFPSVPQFRLARQLTKITIDGRGVPSDYLQLLFVYP
jgi:hypothetical protein